jgi:hypothetical protein
MRIRRCASMRSGAHHASPKASEGPGIRRRHPVTPARFNAAVVVRRRDAQGGFQGRHSAGGLGTLSQSRNNKGPWTGRLEPVHHRRPGARCLDAAHQSLARHPVPQRSRGLPLRRGGPAPAPQLVGEHRRSPTRQARRPDPGAGVSGRAVHQRQPVGSSPVRTNVSGLGETTVPVFWEVAKE